MIDYKITRLQDYRLRILFSGFCFLCCVFCPLAYSITLSGKELAMAAAEYVRGRLLFSEEVRGKGEWRVEPLNTPSSVFVPDSNYKVKIDLPRGIRDIGDTFAWVEIWSEVRPQTRQHTSEGKLIKKIPVALKVRCLLPIVVASRTIGKHEILKNTDVHIELQEVKDEMQCSMFLQDVIGMRARRTIALGQAVRKDMLESPPLVNKGEKVRLLFKRKGVEIFTEGTSGSDGWLNDIVVVEVFSRALESKVVDKKLVVSSQ